MHNQKHPFHWRPQTAAKGAPAMEIGTKKNIFLENVKSEA